MSLADRMKMFGGTGATPGGGAQAAACPPSSHAAPRRTWGTPTVSVHDVIAKVAANDAGLQTVDLSSSAIFQMKSDDLMAQLCSALAANTHVTDLVLVNCNIGQNGCTSLGQALAKNAVLKNINLEKNCVNQEGATALAQGLAKNTGVRVIDLMNQKNCRWGDQCLDAFLDMFQTNTTLLKINWRLESRKSFALNKMITRNNEIDRRKKNGMSYNNILPTSLQDPNQPTSSIPATSLSSSTATATPSNAASQHVGKENEVDGTEAGGGSRPSATVEAQRAPSPGKDRPPADSSVVASSSHVMSRHDPPPPRAAGEDRPTGSIAGRWQPPVSAAGGGGGAGGGEVFVRPKRGANSVLNRYVCPRVQSDADDPVFTQKHGAGRVSVALPRTEGALQVASKRHRRQLRSADTDRRLETQS